MAQVKWLRSVLILFGSSEVAQEWSRVVGCTPKETLCFSCSFLSLGGLRANRRTWGRSASADRYASPTLPALINLPNGGHGPASHGPRPNFIARSKHRKRRFCRFQLRGQLMKQTGNSKEVLKGTSSNSEPMLISRGRRRHRVGQMGQFKVGAWNVRTMAAT
eukprot:2573233-Karenia_brevis.AAC.1